MQVESEHDIEGMGCACGDVVCSEWRAACCVEYWGGCKHGLIPCFTAQLREILVFIYSFYPDCSSKIGVKYGCEWYAGL